MTSMAHIILGLAGQFHELTETSQGGFARADLLLDLIRFGGEIREGRTSAQDAPGFRYTPGGQNQVASFNRRTGAGQGLVDALHELADPAGVLPVQVSRQANGKQADCQNQRRGRQSIPVSTYKFARAICTEGGEADTGSSRR